MTRQDVEIQNGWAWDTTSTPRNTHITNHRLVVLLKHNLRPRMRTRGTDVYAKHVRPLNRCRSVLSVTGSLICFRSLKSLISSLNIDTGFLGFFSRLIMTLTNMNINFFCAKTESDEPRILKGGFQAIKTRDVYICYLRSNPILCTGLSKILQAYTSKQGDLKYKKSSRNTKNVAYSSMNFDLLSAERDKRDFGLSVFELRQERAEHSRSQQHSPSSLSGMPKATVHRTKPKRVDYNDIEVIARIEEACDAVRSGKFPHLA